MSIILDELLKLVTDPEVSNLSVNHYIGSDEGNRTSSGPSCGHCGTPEETKLRFCTGCHLVQYCSVECQDRDWKSHRPACRRNAAKSDKGSEGEPSSQQICASRQVYLPPDIMSNCSEPSCERARSASDKFKYCSACGEAAYCSQACQTKHWKTHKSHCGSTERIELNSFHGLLACLVDWSHNHPLKPRHQAFDSCIINNPGPGAHPTETPAGWAANIVLLDGVLRDLGPHEWWPAAASDEIRYKFFERIRREGYVLPILTAICFALLSEMYTTTSSTTTSPAGTRLRLRYRTSPIIDFGICAGTSRVTFQDKLGYFNLKERTITPGQDPDDHYWLYFLTAADEEVVLDCAMYTFNMALVTDTGPYALPEFGPNWASEQPWAPAFLCHRELRKKTPWLWTERTRQSMLKDEGMHELVGKGRQALKFEESDKAFGTFMKKLKPSGKATTAFEKTFSRTLAITHVNVFRGCFEREDWKGFPAQPATGIQHDPGEMDDLEEKYNEWYKSIEKWRRNNKRMGRKPVHNPTPELEPSSPMVQHTI